MCRVEFLNKKRFKRENLDKLKEIQISLKSLDFYSAVMIILNKGVFFYDQRLNFTRVFLTNF